MKILPASGSSSVDEFLQLSWTPQTAKWDEVMTSSSDEGKSFAYIFLFVCFSYTEMLTLILESLFAFLK